MTQLTQTQKTIQHTLPDRLPTPLFFIVFITVFTLYTLTLAPGVVGGDAGEHQFAIPLLGIPHTTGYPLYILVGKLWTLLIPFGSMAWRMNLFSAFGGALAASTTALVVYRLSILSTPTSPPHVSSKPAIMTGPHHVSSASWAGALVAGIALAFGLTLWQWSVIAGVRSFNIFFFSLLTLQAITWSQHCQENPKSEIRNPKSDLILRWLAFTVGLSLAHHRTTVFYLPSLVAWIWWHDRQLIRHPKRILTLAFLSLAPLSLYLFIYLRGINNPPYTHEPISDFQSFWFLVGSGDSTGLFFSIDPAYLPARLAFIWADILKQLSLPGVILAILGALALLWKRSVHFLFQGLLVLLLLLFTLDFEVVNLNEAPTWYLMPAYFIFAVWLGVGVNGILDFGFTILDWVNKRKTGIQDANLQSPISNLQFIAQLLTTTIAIALLTASLGWPNWQKLYTDATVPLDDWRQLLRGTQAQRFVESSLPYVEPNSIILGDWEQYTPLNYYQFIHGLRPDVSVYNPLNLWPEKVAAAHAAGRPIYFARKPTDLIGTPYLSMVGPLIHIGPTPQFEAPADIIRLEANFEDELELIGYQAQIWTQYPTSGAKLGLILIPSVPNQTREGSAPDRKQIDHILQVTLYWQVPQKVQWDYALSLRLVDTAGRERYKKDAVHPVLSSYPTTLWIPGEVVADFYELSLPSDAGPLTLHLLPYRTEGSGQWHNLILTGTNPPQEGIKLGPFK